MCVNFSYKNKALNKDIKNCVVWRPALNLSVFFLVSLVVNICHDMILLLTWKYYNDIMDGHNLHVQWYAVIGAD